MNDVLTGNLRREAAAAYLGMSLSTFNRLCNTGKIKGYKVSPRKMVFKKEDLDHYVNTVAPQLLA
jgi:excisionase family DNA binding protein